MRNPFRLKMLVSVGLVCLFVFLIQTARFFISSSYVYSAEEIKKEKIKGSAGAKLKIVEYSDFQCPSCSRGAQIINEQYERYPGDISVEFNHFPLATIHPHALTASIFADCAAQQNQFWAFHDFAFETRKEWSRNEKARAFFLEKIKKLDINMIEFKNCIDDEAVLNEILASKSVARMKGLRATPTFYLNGKMVVGTKNLKAEILNVLEGQQHEAR